MNPDSSPSKPKKRPHRTHTRTPQIYRWADIGTEALVYFTILWGPWAFGTVHDWAILTMNLANYGIGALLLTKWAVRYKTGYYPPRWTTQKNGQSTIQPPKRDWRTKAVAALTIYMLGYILISILNVRATFNHEFNFFEYQENYIKWLPHTYDKSATTQSFLQFLGLASCFWSIRDWLLGQTKSERMENINADKNQNLPLQENFSFPNIPNRLNRLLWLLCISGGLLALVGILQRLDGTPKLLWLYERERFGTSDQSFGPFGYRGNAASYLNMILPICIGLLMTSIKRKRFHFGVNKHKTNDMHYILIPISVIIIAGQMISLSRGGSLILGMTLVIGFGILLFKPYLLSKYQRFGVAFFLLVCAIVSCFVGIDALLKRFDSSSYDPWYKTSIALPNFGEEITYECTLPEPPYDMDRTLFQFSNSRNESFLKSFFRTTLSREGHLSIILFNKSTNSHIASTYTNITEHISEGKLSLSMSRTDEGMEVKAGGISLKGIETTYGNMPPDWTLPVVPREILAYTKASVKEAAPELESHLLIIQPRLLDSMTKDQNTEKIEINFEEKLTWSGLLSRLSSRGRIYSTSLEMLKAHKWLGSGAGSWATAYFIYHPADEAWEAWAHCDWLEYGINFGFWGMIPIILLIYIVIFPAKSGSRVSSSEWIVIALYLSIGGCLIHALIDFPLQVVSTTHLFIVISLIKMITHRRETKAN